MITQKIRREILSRKKRCSGCKKELQKRDLCIHHIDGNKKNNTIKNLLVVCRSCHMKIHHPKSRKLSASDKYKIIECKLEELSLATKKEKNFIELQIKLWEEDLFSNTSEKVLSFMGGK